MILLSPDTIFDQLYDVDQIFCKDGFYNSVNSSEPVTPSVSDSPSQPLSSAKGARVFLVNSSEVFKCKACDCDTKSNLCDKRTGTCFCEGKLLTTNRRVRGGTYKKMATHGFSRRYKFLRNYRKNRIRTNYIKVVGNCCWQISGRNHTTEEFRPGEEKKPKIAYIKMFEAKQCA